MALRLLQPVTHPSRARIRVRRRFGLWRLTVNGSTMYRTFKRADAVVLAGFIARLASPSTLEVAPTRKVPGEYREF